MQEPQELSSPSANHNRPVFVLPRPGSRTATGVSSTWRTTPWRVHGGQSPQPRGQGNAILPSQPLKDEVNILTHAGIQSHRLLWVREMTEEEISHVGETEPTIDSIEVAEFESHAALKVWLRQKALAFAQQSLLFPRRSFPLWQQISRITSAPCMSVKNLPRDRTIVRDH